MTKIDNQFLRSHFTADYVEDLGNGWAAVQQAVLGARNVLSQPAKFPKANFDYLEKLDLEGTCFLLRAPVQYIV